MSNTPRRDQQTEGRSPHNRPSALNRPTTNSVNILREVEYIQDRASDHDARLVCLAGPALVLFSTHSGDAWLLDGEDHWALRLARNGDPEPLPQIDDGELQFKIDWPGQFSLQGDAFVVMSKTGRVSTVIGYPVESIREALTTVLKIVPADYQRAKN